MPRQRVRRPRRARTAPVWSATGSALGHARHQEGHGKAPGQIAVGRPVGQQDTLSAARRRPRALHCSAKGLVAISAAILRCVGHLALAGPLAWRASKMPSSSKLSRMAAMAWVSVRRFAWGAESATRWARRSATSMPRRKTRPGAKLALPERRVIKTSGSPPGEHRRNSSTVAACKGLTELAGGCRCWLVRGMGPLSASGGVHRPRCKEAGWKLARRITTAERCSTASIAVLAPFQVAGSQRLKQFNQLKSRIWLIKAALQPGVASLQIIQNFHQIKPMGPPALRAP